MIEVTHYILGNSMAVIQVQPAPQDVYVNPAEHLPVQVDGHCTCKFSTKILHPLHSVNDNIKL